MKKTILACLVLLLILTAGGALRYYQVYYKPNSVENKADIYVYENGSYEAFLDSLAGSGSVIDMKTFTRAAEKLSLAGMLKAGHYRLSEGLDNKAIVRVFANGYQTPVNLQIRGYIHSWESMAAYLGRRLHSDSTAFITAMRDSALMDSLGFRKETYLSMFIPDTYEVWWTASPESILKRMKKEYDAFWNESRSARAAEIGLTRDEVMTLASIVIEETKHEPEMPIIAGVYINRLKRGMLLQADPTVKFALSMEGITRILNKHLKTDSPYNTYVNAGLPPGPITIAPKSAIEAVLNYKHHNYLFFCARDTFDGQHNFAATYSEHLKNARAYQRALNARTSSKAVL